jgi:hypothetical protein
VRQPWAFAWLHGKPVENRTRYMAHRGPLWLHAGARSRWDPYGAASPLVQRAWFDYLRSDPQLQGTPLTSAAIALTQDNALMPFGAVTALAEVTGCHPSYHCQERGGCSPWAVAGQFHIEFTVSHVLAEPVECRGALGLWRLPDDVDGAARRQLPVAVRP